MPKVQKNFLDKVKVLADNVKLDLRKKGVVLPVKHPDGTITFDEYSVVKKNDCFLIVNSRGREIAGSINLPQTAIVIANNLALGKPIDDKLVEHDRWYGYKLFDEEVYTKSATNSLKNKDYDKADWCFTRAKIAKEQKEQHKTSIMTQYSRLRTA